MARLARWKTTSGRAARTAARTAAASVTSPPSRREKPLTSAPSASSQSVSQRPLKPVWPVTRTRRPDQNAGSGTARGMAVTLCDDPRVATLRILGAGGWIPTGHARHLLRAAARRRRGRPDRRGHRARAARRRPLAARGGRDARPRADPLPPRPRGRARLHAGAARGGRHPAAHLGPRARRYRRLERRDAPAHLHAAVRRRGLRAGRARGARAGGRRAAGRPVHGYRPPPGGPQHADAGAALRRPASPTARTRPTTRATPQFARGSRVLLHEAWATEGAPEQTAIHSSGREAARVAGEAGVERLVLIHLHPLTGARRDARGGARRVPCRRARARRPGDRALAPRPSRARRPSPTAG